MQPIDESQDHYGRLYYCQIIHYGSEKKISSWVKVEQNRGSQGFKKRILDKIAKQHSKAA